MELTAGTSLTLVAIRPCDDPNGSCGYWQGIASAFAFRIESEPFAGEILELWGSLQEPPPSARLLDPGATVSFRERVQGRLVARLSATDASGS